MSSSLVKAGCVIMASGLGRRFGGNKLMADFRGEPMIARALEATRDLFESRVVVTRHRDVAEFCRLRGVRVVLHDLPYRSDTVRLGLEAVGLAQGCLFCPGDQPLLRRETVAALTADWQAVPDMIWRLSFEGTPGAPVLFPRWTFPELGQLPQGKGGGAVIKKYPDRVRLHPIRDGMELIDADTPSVLRQLERAAKNSPLV